MSVTPPVFRPRKPTFNPTSSQPTFAFQDGELVSQFGLFSYYNYDQAIIRGLDVGVDYSLGQNLTLSGAVSLIDKVSTNGDDFLPSLSLNVPKTKVKGSLRIEDVGISNSFVRVTGRWKASHEFRAGYWNSDLFYEDGRLPDRYSVGLSAGYTIPGTGLEVKGRAVNLLDTRVPDKLGAPQTGRLITFSASYTLQGLNL